MSGFNFERDLPHQHNAVQSVIDAFEGIAHYSQKAPIINPELALSDYVNQFKKNCLTLQKKWNLTQSNQASNPANVILDVAMETGTGKTYVYTKTMFELNKQFGLFKFIVAVPRVAIKAGAVSFLSSDAVYEHFKLDFDDKKIKVHQVISQKTKKNKRDHMPQAVMDFCRADFRTDPNTIHVLVINSGMINSPTMQKAFDVALYDQFSVPFDALAITRPVLIIDEPHLFKTENKSFENLSKVKPQFTLRYGATFDNKFENLIYQLTAVDAFNQDLVKGIVAHVEEFEEGNKTTIKLTNLGDMATFELNNQDTRTSHKLAAKENLSKIHSAMQDLFIVRFNKTVLELSNGLILNKGDVFNPYSYAETLQNKMIEQAIVRHFEIERLLLTQTPRIKPLSLFFIDNIASYRDKNGLMRSFFEQAVTAHLKSLIAAETHVDYKQHLEVALKDVSALHGGYFSADNNEKDDDVEQEMHEILHGKELLLDIANPRRFIFSKWTLREGWDNPNIFQICKLRSSGSETSKLQEVGRGLRLPVNEFMSRDKNQQHFLHYCVDFTEKEFTQQLIKEINEKSSVIINKVNLDKSLREAILNHYPDIASDEALLELLDEVGIIKRNNDFKEGGYQSLKERFPKAFKSGLKEGKVKISATEKKKTTLRIGQFEELRALWETISCQVTLEYKLDEQRDFKALLHDYFVAHKQDLILSGSRSYTEKLGIEQINNLPTMRSIKHVSLQDKVLPIRMMGYRDFLMRLSKEMALNIGLIHDVLTELIQSNEFDINPYLSQKTIRAIKHGFNTYLMENVFAQFKVNYKKLTNVIHPTVFTDSAGKAVSSIDSNKVGIYFEEGVSPDNYLFNEIFYDEPDLELSNIKNQIKEVVVYTKIPKNSVRIPLAGGGTYSPDFAYVVKGVDGKSELNLIVESKAKADSALSAEENQKIKHANDFFNQINSAVKVTFKKQLKNTLMTSLIKDAMTNE